MKTIFRLVRGAPLLVVWLATVVSAGAQEAQSYDYADKELWYDTTLYGGKMSPARIVAGNGSEGFDVEKFINSEMGERIMAMIKNELVIYGEENWNTPEMAKYWADRGVIKEVHNRDSRLRRSCLRRHGR